MPSAPRCAPPWAAGRVRIWTRRSDVVHVVHADVLSRFEAGEIVGFHGQTLAHDPGGRGTHQLGDGDALARALGRVVVWDFRSQDVRSGGQGAPLAPFYHFACAHWMQAAAPVAFLNLGGVGNLTWVDPSRERPEEPGALLAFDTGPANAPINDLVSARLGRDCDRDGALAATGRVDRDAVARFLQEPFFRKVPPKSLDRDDFAILHDLVAQMGDADAAATLTAMAVEAVVQGVALCPARPAQLLVTGGGRHNPAMMEMLRDALPCEVLPVEAAGLDGDMLEAQAFAFLAVRVARGLPTSCPTTTGVPMPVCGGRISAP